MHPQDTKNNGTEAVVVPRAVEPLAEAPMAETVIPPSPPAPEEPKPHKKLFMITGIIVILLILAGVGAFAFTQMQKPAEEIVESPSPTPEAMAENETSGWETYTNTRSNFQLKYPSNWTGKSVNPGPPESDPDPESYGFTVFPNIYDSAPDAKNHISIETDGIWNKAHKNYEDWLDDLTTTPYYTVQNTTSGMLNQISATIVTGTYDGYGYPAIIKTYLFSSDDKQTYFSVSVVSEASGRFSAEIDQILSTFEFIDSSGSMSDWKTYTNTEYGYSIDYPSNWSTSNVAAGNTAPEALPNSLMVDIETNNPEDGMASIQIFQSMPSKPDGFTESRETLGNNAYVVYSSNVHNMLSKDYYLNLGNGYYLEILTRPISPDNEQTFKNMLSSVKKI